MINLNLSIVTFTHSLVYDRPSLLLCKSRIEWVNWTTNGRADPHILEWRKRINIFYSAVQISFNLEQTRLEFQLHICVSYLSTHCWLVVLIRDAVTTTRRKTHSV